MYVDYTKFVRNQKPQIPADKKISKYKASIKSVK
jgi:hypothetical protein